jgi:transcriptional regulator with GAF, ATPase, and Fis domain
METEELADQVARSFAEKVRREKNGSLAVALDRLAHELHGAAGAMVFVVGIAPDGNLTATRFPSAPEPKGDRIRPYRDVIREVDHRVFRQALEATEGSVAQAAKLLGLPNSTFRYRVQQLGLVHPKPRVKRERVNDPYPNTNPRRKARPRRRQRVTI